MEQTLATWLLPIVGLIAGIAIGYLVARSSAPNRTQRQVDDLQERFDTYQSEVVTHFNTTASLLRKLTQNYQDIQEHLSDGASRLALDEQTRQRLMAALHEENHGSREPLSSRPSPNRPGLRSQRRRYPRHAARKLRPEEPSLIHRLAQPLRQAPL